MDRLRLNVPSQFLTHGAEQHALGWLYGSGDCSDCPSQGMIAKSCTYA